MPCPAPLTLQTYINKFVKEADQGFRGGLGGPKRAIVNFTGSTVKLRAIPHNWGFAKIANEQHQNF